MSFSTQSYINYIKYVIIFPRTLFIINYFIFSITNFLKSFPSALTILNQDIIFPFSCLPTPFIIILHFPSNPASTVPSPSHSPLPSSSAPSLFHPLSQKAPGDKDKVGFSLFSSPPPPLPISLISGALLR